MGDKANSESDRAEIKAKIRRTADLADQKLRKAEERVISVLRSSCSDVNSTVNNTANTSNAMLENESAKYDELAQSQNKTASSVQKVLEQVEHSMRQISQLKDMQKHSKKFCQDSAKSLRQDMISVKQ
jgi:hypothetical protein